MRSWFYLLLAYVFLFTGVVIAIQKEWDFTTLIAFVALGWCCKLESER